MITLCADDEFCDNHVISDIVRYFKNNDYLIATGYRVCYDKNLENIRSIYPEGSDITYLCNDSFKLYNRLCKSNFIAGSCTPYTKEFINKYSLFNEEYKLLEDWPRYLNITQRGCKIGFIDKHIIKHRFGGITTDHSNKKIDTQLQLDVQKMYEIEFLNVVSIIILSYNQMLKANVVICTSMFRKSDYEKTNGYNPNMIYGNEDWDLWISFIELEKKFHEVLN